MCEGKEVEIRRVQCSEKARRRVRGGPMSTESAHKGKGDPRGKLIAHDGEAVEGGKERRVIGGPDSRVGA